MDKLDHQRTGIADTFIFRKLRIYRKHQQEEISCISAIQKQATTFYTNQAQEQRISFNLRLFQKKHTQHSEL